MFLIYFHLHFFEVDIDHFIRGNCLLNIVGCDRAAQRICSIINPVIPVINAFLTVFIHCTMFSKSSKIRLPSLGHKIGRFIGICKSRSSFKSKRSINISHSCPLEDCNVITGLRISTVGSVWYLRIAIQIIPFTYPIFHCIFRVGNVCEGNHQALIRRHGHIQPISWSSSFDSLILAMSLVILHRGILIYQTVFLIRAKATTIAIKCSVRFFLSPIAINFIECFMIIPDLIDRRTRNFYICILRDIVNIQGSKPVRFNLYA